MNRQQGAESWKNAQRTSVELDVFLWSEPIPKQPFLRPNESGNPVEGLNPASRAQRSEHVFLRFNSLPARCRANDSEHRHNRMALIDTAKTPDKQRWFNALPAWCVMNKGSATVHSPRPVHLPPRQ